MSSNEPVKAEDATVLIDIWKKTVETQMHFNEMSVKSRQLGLTFVAAALGLSVVMFSQQRDYSFDIAFGLQIHVALLLMASGALALRAVKQLDLHVYHRMLRGAVTFGEDFEENYLKKIFVLNKGMTQAISHYSRYADASVVKFWGGTKYLYAGGEKLSAEIKIEAFYKNSERFVWLAVFLMFAATNIHHWKSSAQGQKPATPTEVAAKDTTAH